jgi:hypothetical protein
MNEVEAFFAELDEPGPLPCDWAELHADLHDPCSAPATWRLQRRLVCAHGASFPAGAPVTALLCEGHVVEARTMTVTCMACLCRKMPALYHTVEALERLPR